MKVIVQCELIILKDTRDPFESSLLLKPEYKRERFSGTFDSYADAMTFLAGELKPTVQL